MGEVGTTTSECNLIFALNAVNKCRTAEGFDACLEALKS